MEEIKGRVDFSKKSETFEYINSFLPTAKIKAIFTLDAPMWNYHWGFRVYDSDVELYVLFENDMCFVIKYFFIDALNIEIRPLSEKEYIQYNETIIKDCFNSVDDIYNQSLDKVIRTETISLEYEAIERVTLNSVSYEYDKWINHSIVDVQPTEETFDEIRLHMKNGKIITICPQSAEADGYVMFWSEDTVETIEEK